MKIYTALLFSVLSIYACKAKKELKSEKVEESKTSMTINFIRKGSGIDHDAFKQIDSILLVNKSNCDFEYELIKYGREGERQFCFENLSSECKKLILQSTSSLASNDRVQIKEGGSCRK